MRTTLVKQKSRGPALRRAVDRSLVDSAYQALLERIVTGALPSGTIISELALAQELGVSRTPVHDAVRQLAKDGLVVREGRRLARVAALSPDDVFEIFEMRNSSRARQRSWPQPAWTAGTSRPCVRPPASCMQCPPASQPGPWADFDELFHRTIASASGNRRLAQDIARYRLIHRGFSQLSTDAVALQKALREHLSIIAAIEAKDGALARQRMVAHIAVWQDFFLRRVFGEGAAAGDGSKSVPAARPRSTRRST